MPNQDAPDQNVPRGTLGHTPHTSLVGDVYYPRPTLTPPEDWLDGSGAEPAAPADWPDVIGGGQALGEVTRVIDPEYRRALQEATRRAQAFYPSQHYAPEPETPIEIGPPSPARDFLNDIFDRWANEYWQTITVPGADTTPGVYFRMALASHSETLPLRQQFCQHLVEILQSPIAYDRVPQALDLYVRGWCAADYGQPVPVFAYPDGNPETIIDQILEAFDAIAHQALEQDIGATDEERTVDEFLHRTYTRWEQEWVMAGGLLVDPNGVERHQKWALACAPECGLLRTTIRNEILQYSQGNLFSRVAQVVADDFRNNADGTQFFDYGFPPNPTPVIEDLTRIGEELIAAGRQALQQQSFFNTVFHGRPTWDPEFRRVDTGIFNQLRQADRLNVPRVQEERIDTMTDRATADRFRWFAQDYATGPASVNPFNPEPGAPGDHIDEILESSVIRHYVVDFLRTPYLTPGCHIGINSRDGLCYCWREEWCNRFEIPREVYNNAVCDIVEARELERERERAERNAQILGEQRSGRYRWASGEINWSNVANPDLREYGQGMRSVSEAVRRQMLEASRAHQAWSLARVQDSPLPDAVQRQMQTARELQVSPAYIAELERTFGEGPVIAARQRVAQEVRAADALPELDRAAMDRLAEDVQLRGYSVEGAHAVEILQDGRTHAIMENFSTPVPSAAGIQAGIDREPNEDSPF